MKCCVCEDKAEIYVKKPNKMKVPYCRLHWKMLCLQETVKLFKMNQWSLENFGKFTDEIFTVSDFFEHMTKH